MEEQRAMFRRVMLCAVVAVTLAAIPLSAETTTKRDPGVAERGTSTSYAVYRRKQGTAGWSLFRAYRTHREASAAARDLYQKSWEVQIHARVTMTRVPARPRTGSLPSGETITLAQANQVFRWMAGQSDISYRYPADGCYARAHLMIRRMVRRGMKPWKVWTFANGESLYVRTSNIPSGHVEWRYHVAPILRVRLQNGKQRWYVIDPSLFRRPVPIATWKNAQRRPSSRYQPYVTLTRLGQAPVGPTGKRLPGTGYWPGHDPRGGQDSHAVRMMKVYKPLEGRMPPRTVAFASPFARPDLFALPAGQRRSRAA